MTIKIQPAALADLANGYRFYEATEAGLGGYFLALYSDIDSLQIHAGKQAMEPCQMDRVEEPRMDSPEVERLSLTRCASHSPLRYTAFARYRSDETGPPEEDRRQEAAWIR